MNIPFYEEEFKNYPVVIVADGELPAHAAPLKLLQQAQYTICCDGAISHVEQLGYEPHLIIGDCDSISYLQRKKYEKIIIENKSIDYSDLHKTIRYAIENGMKKVAIVGATGLREDHELANLSLLLTYGKKIDLLMVTNFGIFMPIFETKKINSFVGQQISIFNFNNAKVTFHQLKYPVLDRHFNYFWEGSLNEATAESFTIFLQHGATLVYRAYKSSYNKRGN